MFNSRNHNILTLTLAPSGVDRWFVRYDTNAKFYILGQLLYCFLNKIESRSERLSIEFFKKVIVVYLTSTSIIAGNA